MTLRKSLCQKLYKYIDVAKSNKLKERGIVLIEIALETAVPLGGRSGDGEPGEELGDRARRR